mmetsp:Transcript_12414/g.43438  ORF Transcript_12414/g.43438 Transcript_12414/m.43438 type:complete len:461 (-) Transcript_12414:120-1502(-)
MLRAGDDIDLLLARAHAAAMRRLPPFQHDRARGGRPRVDSIGEELGAFPPLEELHTELAALDYDEVRDTIEWVATAQGRDRAVVRAVDKMPDASSLQWWLFAGFLAHSHVIVELDLSDNILGVAGARHLGEALRVSGTLRSLTVANTELNESDDTGRDGGSALCVALGTNTTLRHLDLRNSGLRRRGAECLGEALLTNTTLQTLNLSGNSGAIKAPSAITRALRKNPRCALEELFLDRVSCDLGVAMDAASVLKQNTVLKVLSLEANEEFEGHFDEVADAFAESLLFNRTLRTLNLAKNTGASIDMADMGSARALRGTRSLGIALAANTTLLDLKTDIGAHVCVGLNGPTTKGLCAFGEAASRINTLLKSNRARYNAPRRERVLVAQWSAERERVRDCEAAARGVVGAVGSGRRRGSGASASRPTTATPPDAVTWFGALPRQALAVVVLQLRFTDERFPT